MKYTLLDNVLAVLTYYVLVFCVFNYCYSILCCCAYYSQIIHHIVTF
jgi:hypothetical protein